MNFAVLQCLFLFFVATSAKFSIDMAACKAGPNHDECLAKNIQNFIVKYGKTGIPEINLPQFEPMNFDSLTIGAGTGAVDIVQNFKNIKVTGYTDRLKITNAHWDAVNLNLTFTSTVPQVSQNAEYDINGKLLVIPVYGHGHCTVNFIGLEIKHDLQFVKENRKNDVFLKVKSYDPEVLNIQGVTFHFDNLFDGNKELGDKVNKMFNDEWKAVYDDVIDNYVEAYKAVLRPFVERVFENIPFKDLLHG